MFIWFFGKPVASEEAADHIRRIGTSDPNRYESHFDYGLSDKNIREKEQRDQAEHERQRQQWEEQERQREQRRQMEEQARRDY